MAAFDRPQLTLAQVRRYVGNGSRRLIELALGEDAADSEVERVLDWYKPWYDAHCRILTRPYPGLLPMMERLKAAYVATSIAEFFRDKGEKVLLLMDSVTRFGRAQREIGLAAGEPPTRRGFPPSVFSELPKLMERAGNSDKGSITALYTVLVEGDDMTEPIADETRSILDGHIILSRKLAQKNHYPAIDVLQSVSRCQSAIIEKDHKAAAAKLREILAKYAEVELLLKIGEYQKGADPSTDEAIAKIDAVNGFLRQGLQERPSYDETISKLKQVVA
jgi:type III secretion protein N (ATPase)